jgi:carboxymethylenebutenolidase
MKYFAILGMLAVGLAGGWYVTNQAQRSGESMVPEQALEDAPEERNVALMESATGMEVATEDGVAYFPNALGFYAEPMEPGNYPGIVMIHENRGLRPEIKQAAEELAAEGYRVLAVDLYKGTVMETQEEARAYTGFDQAEGLQNMQVAVAYLQARGAERIASLGWCFGGRQSVELAISGVPLDATVVYYGGGMATSTEALAPIAWPVLGIFGAQDRIIPLSMVEDFETSLNTLGIENEVYVYEGVGHAFANPSNDNFAPEATADAWARTLAFLEAHLR